MDFSTKKSCQFEGRTYGHGDIVREDGKDKRCSDGHWEERIDMFITAGP